MPQSGGLSTLLRFSSPWTTRRIPSKVRPSLTSDRSARPPYQFKQGSTSSFASNSCTVIQPTQSATTLPLKVSAWSAPPSLLGGISLLDWQTKLFERAVGTNHVNLAFRGLALFPADCAAWLIRSEADKRVNVFEASTGLFPMLTGQEPPFEAAIDWLQIAYTADRGGGLMWRLRPRSSSSLR